MAAEMTYRRVSIRAWLLCSAASALLAAAGKAHAHSGHLDKAALEVCKERTRSQACEYTGHHDDLYIGTCQYISDRALTCVRNQPIRKTRPGTDASGSLLEGQTGAAFTHPRST